MSGREDDSRGKAKTGHVLCAHSLFHSKALSGDAHTRLPPGAFGDDPHAQAVVARGLQREGVPQKPLQIQKVGRGSDHCRILAVGVAGDVGLDAALRGEGCPPADREVRPHDRPLSELRRCSVRPESSGGTNGPRGSAGNRHSGGDPRSLLRRPQKLFRKKGIG